MQRTQQRVRMSARTDGTLTSLRHEAINDTGMLDEYDENCGEATPYFYGTPNLLVTGAQTRRHVGSPTAMRGPGAVPGLYATESAYDELAIALGMDPVQLRLHNEPDRDQDLGLPFSSRHYAECLTVGAEKFGWSRRCAEVGSMRANGSILGWGVAGCSWIAGRFAAEAVARVGVTKIGVTRGGLVDLDQLRATLASGPPALVSVMAANNETGVIQPVAAVPPGRRSAR